MGKSLIITDEVLDINLNDSKETLAYLKAQKHELITMSSLKKQEQQEKLKQQGLIDYFDYLLPDVTLHFINHMFFDNLKKEIIYRRRQNNSLLRHCKEALWIDDSHCIVVTNQLQLCQQADQCFWKGIYFDDGKKNVISGLKIKKLSTLMHRY